MGPFRYSASWPTSTYGLATPEPPATPENLDADGLPALFIDRIATLGDRINRLAPLARHPREIEVSALDVLALAIYLSLSRGGEPLPFKVAMGFYLAAVLLSAIQATVPFAAIFYVWQLARVFLVYAVVTKACADERVAPSLLKGLAIGLCFEACVVIWDRFHLGVIQASGTFGHQNLLGMVSHFVLFPFFALLIGWRARVVAERNLAGRRHYRSPVSLPSYDWPRGSRIRCPVYSFVGAKMDCAEGAHRLVWYCCSFCNRTGCGIFS